MQGFPLNSIGALIIPSVRTYATREAKHTRKQARSHLKLVHVAVHATGRGRAEGARSIAFGGLRGARVIDDVVHQVLREACEKRAYGETKSTRARWGI